MHRLTLLTTLLLPLLSFAATTHIIAVAEHGLVYTPNTTHAAVGDTITFLFYPANHNVVQGPFSTPCQPGDNKGIYSGADFPPSTGPTFSSPIGNVVKPSNSTFEVKINDTDPIWFYCSVKSGGGHCTKGMVGVINPPADSNQTLDAYKLAASKVSNETYSEPGQVQGGVVVLGGADVMTTTTAVVVGNSTSTLMGASKTSTSWVSETTTVSGHARSTSTVLEGPSSTGTGAGPTATAGAGQMEGRGWALGAFVVGLVVALL